MILWFKLHELTYWSKGAMYPTNCFFSKKEKWKGKCSRCVGAAFRIVQHIVLTKIADALLGAEPTWKRGWLDSAYHPHCLTWMDWILGFWSLKPGLIVGAGPLSAASWIGCQPAAAQAMTDRVGWVKRTHVPPSLMCHCHCPELPAVNSGQHWWFYCSCG